MNEELNVNDISTNVEEIITETTEQTVSDTGTTVSSVFDKIYTISSVLTFTIIVIFLYKYLKSCFAFRK